MAYLRYGSIWEPNIYRIKTTDPITGGEDGYANIQPRQLASRTQFLANMLLREHLDTGRHAIFDYMVEDDAAIDPEKTTVVPMLAGILARVFLARDMLSGLRTRIGDTLGSDGRLIAALTAAQVDVWASGLSGFSWEMFCDGLTMADYNGTEVIQVAANDDTVLCESTSGLNIGESYVIWSDGTDPRPEEFVLRKIFDSEAQGGDPSFASVEDFHVTRTSGHIGKSSFVIEEDGTATARSGDIYLSCRLPGKAGTGDASYIVRSSEALDVYFRLQDNEWEPAYPYKTVTASDGLASDYYYSIPQGSAYVKVENKSDHAVSVHSIAVAYGAAQGKFDVIRQPHLVFESSDIHEFTFGADTYRNAYRDPESIAEFEISRTVLVDGTAYIRTTVYSIPTGGGDCTVTTLFTDVETGAVNTALGSVEHTEAVLDGEVYRVNPDQLATQLSNGVASYSGSYTMRCRYWSDIMDNPSEWSEPVTFIMEGKRRYFSFEGADPVLSGGFNNPDAPMRSLGDEFVRFGFNGTPDSDGFGNATFIMPNA